MRYAGATLDPLLDEERLSNQMLRIHHLMSDGLWRTLGEISSTTNDPEASVSTRLRDLRKSEYGGFCVEKRRRGIAESGLWEYRLMPSSTALTIPKMGKRNPFMAGVMYAAKIMLEQPDMPAAKAALKAELLSLKAKYST